MTFDPEVGDVVTAVASDLPINRRVMEAN
jgi:hypothetical protein